MNKKILFIILIVLVIFFSAIYNKRVNAERYVSDELLKHHAALFSIVGSIERYSINVKNVDEMYIKSLLIVSRNFELFLNSYNNAYSKKMKNNNVQEITSIINNYFDLFVESVSMIDEVDYESLDMIKNDLEKWGIWVEENYMYIDKDGYTAYEMYTFDDIIESGLINELRLASFGFIFKDVHRKLNLDDAEDGNLTNTDNDEELREDLSSIILRYQWNIGIKNYKLVEILNESNF